MFERFTDRARDVVRRALEEARVEGQRPVGTEHLLLALLDDDAGLASRVLADAGVRADDLRERVRRHTASGGVGLGDADAAALRRSASTWPRSWPASSSPSARTRCGRRCRRRAAVGGVGATSAAFSPRSKKALELSLREALRLRHRHIGTEHILLGVLREGHGLGALVLTESGIDLDDLRRRVELALRAPA
ncbi:Clp protease N-terminal domain-containing protein [Micromonospora sp. M12]